MNFARDGVQAGARLWRLISRDLQLTLRVNPNDLSFFAHVEP